MSDEIFSGRVRRIDATNARLLELGLAFDDERSVNDLKAVHQVPSIAVVGLVSRGKSTLINRLVGANLLATGQKPVTFGCGFLQSGAPLAEGMRPDGTRVSLPTSPDDFRARTSRHDAQDLQDFEYTGPLRLPPDVILVDTKGLDEVNSDFRPGLLELERSWAKNGALSAVLVTSVPPGASARDVKLHQTLVDYFEGRVLVVVKQTDSSVEFPDVQEASTVWSQHRADVLTLPDETPLPTESWGSGPLATLERRLSQIWDQGVQLRSESAGRLERRLIDLADELPKARTREWDSNADFFRTKLWDVVRDTEVLEEVRQIAIDRLILDYPIRGRLISNMTEFHEAVEMALLGSSHAKNLIIGSLTTNSSLRANTFLADLVSVLDTADHELASEVIREVVLSSVRDYEQLTKLIDTNLNLVQRYPQLELALSSFLREARDEKVLLELLRNGTPRYAVLALSHLIVFWHSALDGQKLSSIGPNQILASVQKHASVLSEWQSQMEISRHLVPLLHELNECSRNWATDGSIKYSEFKSVVANRSAVVVERLVALQGIATLHQAGEIRQLSLELKEESAKQSWLTKAVAIEQFEGRHSSDFKVYLTRARNISAGVAVIFAAASPGFSFFLGCVTAWSFYCLRKIKSGGIFVVTPFSDDTEMPSLREQQQRFVGTSLIYLLTALIFAAGPGPRALVGMQTEPNSGHKDIAAIVVSSDSAGSIAEGTVSVKQVEGLAASAYAES